MAITWTIKGEAGKAVDATARTLPELQAEEAVVEFRSLDSDRLMWTVWLGTYGESAALVPTNGQRITLYRNGARYFTGNVVNPRIVAEKGRVSAQITVEGPWWWLRNMSISNDLEDQSGQTKERTAYVFPTGGVKNHLQGLITRAIAAGAPIQAGSIADTFNIPRLSLRNISYAEAFAELMRWLPDGTLYFDYTGADTEDPALCMQRRGAASTVTIVPSLGIFPKIDISPRLELKLAAVRIAYATRATVDNKRVTQWALLDAGTADPDLPSRQIVTTSGPEMDTYLPQDFTDAVVVRSKLIFPGFTGVSSDLIGSKDERLRQAGGGYSLGIYSGYNQAGNPFTIPGVESMVNDADGSPLPSGYIYWLKTGEPKEWWPKDGYDYVQARATATVHSHVSVDYPPPNGYTPDPPLWAELVGATAFSYIGRLTSEGDLKWITAYTATSSVSFVAVKTSWPTDTTLIRQEDYAFVNPPSDLATNLLAAQNWLPHQGSVSQVIDPGDIPAGHHLGKKMDVMEMLTVHESMGALIVGQTVTLKTGQITYQLGAPARHAYRDLVNRFRQSGADNIVWINDTSPISNPEGPGVPSTYRTLTEDGQVELTEDGETTVDENGT